MEFDSLFQSEIHRKIIIFFHENPASIDTLRGISVWVGHDSEVVKNALQDLVTHGILIENKGATTTGYAYTREQKIIKKIAKFVTQLKKY